MIYFDTNVLVYFSIDQDMNKQKKAKNLIKNSIKNEEFFITPLVLNEYIFVLSKLKILNEQFEKVEFFKNFCHYCISVEDVMNGYQICKKNSCRNINDAIHLTVANKFCKELITFDTDFQKLKNYSKIQINILKD